MSDTIESVTPESLESEELIAEEALPLDQNDPIAEIGQALPADKIEEDAIAEGIKDAPEENDDDLNLLTTPKILAELSDDPVRLYQPEMKSRTVNRLPMKTKTANSKDNRE